MVEQINVRHLSLKSCQKLVNSDLNMWDEPYPTDVIFLITFYIAYLDYTTTSKCLYIAVRSHTLNK